MTGFGNGAATHGTEQISVELKTVNGKFCEVKARLPRELAPLEADFVRLLKDRLARGSVDAQVRRSAVGALAAVPHVDAALAGAYATALREAAKAAGLSAELSVHDLLALEGVVRLEERAPDMAAARAALTEATQAALVNVVAARRREGAALEADLRSRAAAVRRIVERLAVAAPAAVSSFRERLHERVREIMADVPLDPGRLEQEVVLFADRSDVAEELARLRAHMDELDRLLGQDGPVGRQLDFLIQEINREANTTGSKSQATELTRLVVELKTEIERMREQVQNVE
jgi:uncharacterized protein (TIGR00255 family)